MSKVWVCPLCDAAHPPGKWLSAGDAWRCPSCGEMIARPVDENGDPLPADEIRP